MNDQMDKAEAARIITTQGWLADQPKSFQDRLMMEAVVREHKASRLLFAGRSAVKADNARPAAASTGSVCSPKARTATPCEPPKDSRRA